MRVHWKGGVICTVVILTVLCVILYTQYGFTAPWRIQTLIKEMSNTRVLLGTTAKRLEDVLATPQLHSGQMCNSEPVDEGAVHPTRAPSLSRPPFNFKQYLRNKDCRDFKLLLNQPGKCVGDTFLLIAIKSVAEEFEKREVVRKTWGAEGLLNGVKIKMVFLLGVPKNQTEFPEWELLLRYESRVHRDILLWDFQDTFFNLTLKEINFLKWLDVFCPNVKFIFKGDADVYVNVDNIVELLKERSPGEDVFIGDVIYQAQPIRSKKSKYFIPEMVYGQGLYPAYAGGGGFIMSGFTAKRLERACREVELFPIDDVFMGMCLLRIGLKPDSHEGFRTFGIVRPSAAPHLQVFDPCFYRELMVVHSLTVAEMWIMWKLLHDPEVQCNTKVVVKKPFKWMRKNHKNKKE
ncbi:UDP-GlcNAc:betaGal beta-1,3-N-acetylglucosaminyltransferase 9-like [Polyodon spathula]|uniref:UDP-GlcNAc:betaGal beta-1,3-N-acetylglucosaminyltransferase 9-like n=1 Tax=Polyodon spathula TaxID=7913 RepID=UPI001B7EC98A|nr:UDP-GlcNAc:betaGal beta-1,3-N-acetylglucosaminyltransferase 9-like [Polyodon spathula]XP_041124830.1 UDP-GlcNAc:betaGal beta-1,3-N-acetylglucosaminyltransferase 9-like [Polyodon spathula]XP_041124831.1 UDP-GlcNAc:betaGal beta-1,3-N-acetylglucosaminyltransferase 9-like [Polyodon spathula]XP_041124832.1 UDP-GlcNAc:betaGal beta-1,3-N-acetylglucosaminyltransferase 9-like [Polyodon spathula]XP_041124833.1 UDP-GlcNAc:betaGal beta-1,3-N-acetylglucosaminyltransferase 9-like [Polyodon spathula]XP_04